MYICKLPINRKAAIYLHFSYECLHHFLYLFHIVGDPWHATAIHTAISARHDMLHMRPFCFINQGCFHTRDYYETDRTEPNTEPNRTDQYGFMWIFMSLDGFYMDLFDRA